MNTAVEKRRLISKLRGDLAGYDFVGRELMVGDLIVYGATSIVRTDMFYAGLIRQINPVLRARSQRQDQAVTAGRYRELMIVNYVPRGSCYSMSGYFKSPDQQWARVKLSQTIQTSHCCATLWTDPPEELSEMVEYDRQRFCAIATEETAA